MRRFSCSRTTWGTFGHILDDDAEKYDYILSNPPYVTSGTDIIKEEIRRTPRTSKAYPINALGLESLSLEWIVRALRPGGRAFVIIPDGILARVAGRKLRDHILRECYVDAIVSLPVRTFFPNFEHTYILAITKKHSADDAQAFPVFTYLVSNIGERLTSVKREDIDEDDLPEMEGLFRVYMAARGDAKALLERQSARCKLQDIARFHDDTHWVIDRWWTAQELAAIGIQESLESAAKSEVDVRIDAVREALSDYETYATLMPPRERIMAMVRLGDSQYFKTFLGKRVLKKDVNEHGAKVPVYSANVFEPMGLIERSNIKDFVHPSVLWGIDGNFEFNVMAPNTIFATTDHCGAIQILDDSIVPDYLLAALHALRAEESFDRSFQASLSNIRRLSISIPVKKDGRFDKEAQREIAARFTSGAEKRAKLEAERRKLDDVIGRYLSAPRGLPA